MTLDGRGNLFVAESQNQPVQDWTPRAAEGITVAGGHGRGSAANQRDGPADVAIDGHGRIFVADRRNDWCRSHCGQEPESG